MLERGLLPTFSAAALAELEAISSAAAASAEPGGDMSTLRDLTGLLWASIDNDDSRDLDQLTVAEALPGDVVKILVAVADVDALVKDGSAIDAHARHNTTSVYTAAKIFPMLPEEALHGSHVPESSTWSALAVIVEMVVGADGAVKGQDIYRARVRNRAKLAYNSVAAWLSGTGDTPPALAAVNGLAETSNCRTGVAQRLRSVRHAHGALSLETIKARPIFDGDELRGLEPRRQEPRDLDHRGFHDRRQRRDRALSGRRRAFRPFGASSARPNAGIGSSHSPRNTA